MSYPKAFVIGLWQVIAMIPGVSRSAATIIGDATRARSQYGSGILFLPAVPTMVAASGYDLWRLV